MAAVPGTNVHYMQIANGSKLPKFRSWQRFVSSLKLPAQCCSFDA